MHPYIKAWLFKQKLEREYCLWYDATEEWLRQVENAEYMMENTGGLNVR